MGGSVIVQQRSQAPTARLISVNRHHASTAGCATHLARELSLARAFLAGTVTRVKETRSALCTPPPAKMVAAAPMSLAPPWFVNAPLITRVTAARRRSAQTTHAKMAGPAHPRYRRMDRHTARVTQQATRATDARTTRATRVHVKVAARAAWTRKGGSVTAQQDSLALSAS